MNSGSPTKKVLIKPYNWDMFATSIEELLAQLKERITGTFEVIAKHDDSVTSEKAPQKGYDWEVHIRVPTTEEQEQILKEFRKQKRRSAL